MDRITVSLEGKHTSYLEELRVDLSDEDEDDKIGKSAAVREVFDRVMKHDEVVQERDDLRNRVEELRRQLQEANTRIDAANELVEYVEEEQEVQARQRDIQERRARASLPTRVKWMLVGMPVENEGANEE